MTPSELAAIEARANAATEGPWLESGSQITASETDGDGRPWPWMVASDLAPNDCVFLACARADIPALVARVRELEAELAAADGRSFGDALYVAIIDNLRAHYPAESRNLEWDVLPSTLGSLAAERDELRATLANERGEGAGPSEGWTYERDCHWYKRDGTGWWLMAVRVGHRWQARRQGGRFPGEPLPVSEYARDAMKSADLARAGGAT